jgi:hypothetical protein
MASTYYKFFDYKKCLGQRRINRKSIRRGNNGGQESNRLWAEKVGAFRFQGRIHRGRCRMEDLEYHIGQQASFPLKQRLLPLFWEHKACYVVLLRTVHYKVALCLAK